jgi:hypothetical protein
MTRTAENPSERLAVDWLGFSCDIRAAGLLRGDRRRRPHRRGPVGTVQDDDRSLLVLRQTS